MAKPSSKVRVVNPVWNGDGIIKRKVAEFYVAEGRAEWIREGEGYAVSAVTRENGTVACCGKYWREDLGKWIELECLRLIPSHPKNQAAAARAEAWQRECTPDPTTTRLSQAVAAFPKGLQAAQRPTRFKPPKPRDPRALRAYRHFDDDGYSLLRKDGKPRRRLPKLYPDGEPSELRGARLPHESAKPSRPWTMRRVAVGSQKDGISHEWQAFTPLTPEQAQQQSKERKKLSDDREKRLELRESR